MSVDCCAWRESNVGAFKRDQECIHSINKSVWSLCHVLGHFPCVVPFMSYHSLDGRYH